MRQLFMIAAALTLVAGVPAVQAQTIDKNGKCHDSHGQMANMSVCKPPAVAATRCRDSKTKQFAKCDAKGAEPIPAKAK